MAIIRNNNSKYVVVDEKDIGKSRIDLLIDLVYESTGTRFPQDKIRFGKPSELDQRPEIYYDPNTYLPVNINLEYDRRFSTPVSGIMYRRLSLNEYMSKVDFTAVKPEFYPFRISDLLDQINAQLPYALNMDDLVEYEYVTPDQWASGIHITPHPESYIWCGGTHMVSVDTGSIGGGNLIENNILDGFNIYRPENAPIPVPGFVRWHGPCNNADCPFCNELEKIDVDSLDPRVLPYLRAVMRPVNGAFKDPSLEDPMAPGSADYLNTPAEQTDPPPISLPSTCKGTCSGGNPDVQTDPAFRVNYKTHKEGTGGCATVKSTCGCGC